nr:PD-(D/E)XK nuclease family protein [Solidesulfovibrio carbinolicus]
MKAPVSVIPWTEEFFAALARRLLAATGGDFTDVAVLFPLRRAARHLCDRLAELPGLPKPLLLPEIAAIGEWTAALGADCAPVPPVMLDALDRVAILHDIVRDIAATASQDEAFPADITDFFPWGLELAEIMEELFRQGLHGQDMAHLEGQVLAPAAALLGRLGAIHRRYRQRLLDEGLGTPGLLAALAAENAPAVAERFAGKRLFACGFAVLTGAEKTLLQTLWKKGLLELVWHADPALADGGRPVHFACREHKRLLNDWKAKAVVLGDGKARKLKAKADPTRGTLVLDADAANLSSKKLRFIEAHDLHAELKGLEEALHDAQDLESTAIVLPDTGLLSPVLHILPRRDVNISMGYPLARSSLARLLETILALQETRLERGRYHWRELIALLRHPYLKMLRLGAAEPLRAVFHGLEAAIRQGGAYVDPLALPLAGGEDDEPPSPEALALAGRVLGVCLASFDAVDTPRALGNALAGLCDLLLDPEHCGDAWERFLIDAECLFRLAAGIVPALTSGRLADAALPAPTLFALLRRLLADERAPFEAEPLTGLQVLGVLETRLLSFKRLFLLDAVEAKLPGAPRYDPLLPDTLRRLMGLPDSRERDLVAAYNLYRLFFGAEEITVFYRTGSPGSGLFEDKPGRSRFVEQLLWEEEKRLGRVLRPGEPPVSILRLPPCPIPASDPAVPVTGEVADRLAAYLETQKLSASFFDAYLACPLRFFYRYLSPLSPLAEVAEEGDRAAVGEVVHEVLRDFFTPYLNRDIDAADLDATALADLFESRLAGHAAFAALPPDGQLLLARTGRAKLAEAVAATPRTTILALETDLTASLETGGRTFPLYGRADRIDQREDGVVILDYKTGRPPKGQGRFWTDDHLWDRLAADPLAADDALFEDIATRAGSVQLPLYCWLHHAARGETPADAAVVELRDKGQERPLFGPRQDPETRAQAITHHVPQLLVAILRHLANTPSFRPRPDNNRCPYCEFRQACRAL